MIQITVRSKSCFCWLCRASPSLAAKNIINLISVLSIWWCPCVESSLVLLEEGVCYDQCILLANFATLHFVLQGHTCLLLQISLDFLLNIILFILFLAVLSLHCCMWAFSNCGEQGLLCCYGAWASHCNGFSCWGGQALGWVDFSSRFTWAQ